jgi:hypothetical protein
VILRSGDGPGAVRGDRNHAHRAGVASECVRKRLAEDAPPLTSEQVDRIVAILRLSDGDDTQLQHIA